MTRAEWTEKFYEAWGKKTKTVALYDENDQMTYKGPDFSDTAMWIGADPDGTKYCYFGDPYRKEVSVDDTLGSFQSSSFKVADGVVGQNVYRHADGTESNDDGYWHCASFNSPEGGGKLEVGLDLYAIFEDPQAAVDAFYHEVGLMY